MLDDLIDELERRRLSQLRLAYVELVLALGALERDGECPRGALRWHLCKAAGIVGAQVGWSHHHSRPGEGASGRDAEPALSLN